MQDMMEDELIVLFFEELEPILEFLHLHGALPAESMTVRHRAPVKTAI